MEINFERCREECSQELCDLFSREANYPDRFFFWQDRKPNFYSCYSHFKKEACWSWIGRVLGKGVNFCYIELPIGEYQGLPIRYLSDFFVSPQLRKSRAVWEFVSLTTELFKQANQDTLCWGVENSPAATRGLARIFSRIGFEFCYIGTTILRDFYLSPQTSLQFYRQSESPHIMQIKLSELNDYREIIEELFFIQKQSENYFGEEKVLSPFFSRRLDLEVLVKLADIDPQCLILIRRRKGEISQGLLLVDFHQVRKLISTGKSSPITKSIAQGRSLKNLIVSPICSMRGPGFTELIDEAFCYAQRNAYDLVSLRDMPIDESGLSFTHQLVYSRRVFAIFRRDHQLWSNCIKSFEPSTRLRLDSVFL